ncbi:MAG TPA: sensor domain-containing diguanylate cyclase [Rhodocyclaceae bacterium]|nr:sensor domain-containing diguanylate cyclase [Rhodocyclaceae bacterium]
MPEARSGRRAAHELLRQLHDASDFNALLALLATAVQEIPEVDGVLINIHHPDEHNLVCCAARLPPAFSGVEATYRQYTFPETGDDANACAFTQDRVLSLTARTLSRHPGSTRLRFERWHMQHLLIVPLQNEHPTQMPAGTLMAFSQRQTLSQSSGKLIRALTAQATPLIRLHQRIAHWEQRATAIRNSENELFGLLQFVAEVGNLTTDREIYPRIQHEFMRRFNLDWTAVLMVEHGQLRCVDTRFLPADAPWAAAWEAQAQHISFVLDAADGASADVVCRNRMLYFGDVPAVRDLPMSEKDRAVLTTFDRMQTFAVIPIRKNGQATGVLWLGSLQRTHALSPDQLTLIQHLCDFLGAVIDNAHTYTLVEQQRQDITKLLNAAQNRAEALDELASRDRLTGLFNFGSFEIEAARQIAACQRQDSPLSLIMCDIDHFKRFNDNNGHVAGNEVLKEVARRINQTVRDGDYVVRFGGEEFAILLPRCALDAAVRLAERIRQQVSEQPFVIDGEEHRVTLSLGCAQYSSRLTRVYDFTEHADAALYAAKRGGRNRVEKATLE